LPQLANGLNTTVTGTINGFNIDVKLPGGVTVTGLIPSIELSNGATVSPALNTAPSYLFFESDSSYVTSYEVSAGGSTNTYNVIIALSPNVGTSIATNKNINLLVYPNPTSGTVFIQSDVYGVVDIYTTLGNVVLSKEVSAGISTVDVSGLAKGLYTIKYRGANSSIRLAIE
jgi:hypothetical protein